MELKIKAPLDPGFIPMSVAYDEFEKAAKEANGEELVIGCVRNNGYTSTHKMTIFREGTGHDEENARMVERVVKTMLWVRGGYKIIIAGPRGVYEQMKAAYDFGGLREFDRGFMSRVYEHPFEVEYRPLSDAPVDVESATPVGRHLDGCRIGFDAGGSDRKVSAVIDGETVYSEEVVWFPKLQSDPHYHIDGIRAAIKTAASKMPRVDGIGVSTAGVVIANRMMIGSLFIKVSDEDFDKYVKNIYTDIAKEMNVPIEVANDGDVTALAGAMNLNDTNVLGVAMGTSEAGGYVDGLGNIAGWLNELAFVPVDFNPEAVPADEWSGDIGCGVKYFSQDSVIKLAAAAGIELDESASPAEKLKVVQGLMKAGDSRAKQIYETIGVYFGYAVAYYAKFYDIKHVLLMGRVSSGEGGNILIDNARRVIAEVYPELDKKLEIIVPDESARRVGQSIAAASLPAIK